MRYFAGDVGTKSFEYIPLNLTWIRWHLAKVCHFKPYPTYIILVGKDFQNEINSNICEMFLVQIQPQHDLRPARENGCYGLYYTSSSRNIPAAYDHNII